MERCSPTTPTPWGHLWITWESAGSWMAYGQTSMTVPLLHLGQDWRSAIVPHALGTGYLWPGQGPVEVSPLHQLTLSDPGTQHRFSNSHLYVVETAHGHLFTVPTSGPSGQVHKTVILPLLHICRGWGEQSFLSQSHHNSTLQCQLWMWKVLEAGLYVVLCPAQPLEGVPRVCHQETSYGL